MYIVRQAGISEKLCRILLYQAAKKTKNNTVEKCSIRLSINVKFRRWNLQQFTVKKRRLSLSKNVKIRCRYLLYFAVGKCRILLSKSVLTRRRKMSENAVGKWMILPSGNTVYRRRFMSESVVDNPRKSHLNGWKWIFTEIADINAICFYRCRYK